MVLEKEVLPAAVWEQVRMMPKLQWGKAREWVGVSQASERQECQL